MARSSSSRHHAGSGQPFGALVSTPRGMVPVGQLAGEPAASGRRVYDAQGVTTVRGVLSGGRRGVRRLRLFNGGFVEAAGSLPLRVVSPGGVPEWCRAGAVRPGARLQLHAHRGRIGDAPEVEGSPLGAASDPVTVAASGLVGWIQADGCIVPWGRDGLAMELNTAGPDELRWVSSLAAVVMPAAHQDVAGGRLRASDPSLAGLAACWPVMEPPAAMRVPMGLWTGHIDEVVAYLRSIFQVHGQISAWAGRGENASIALALSGERWVEEVHLLLASLGIYAGRTPAGSARTGRRRRPGLRIDVGSERARFAEVVGFVGRSKQRLLLQSLGLRSASRCPDVRREEVVAVEDLGTQPVWQLATDSGNYLSNNVVVGGADLRTPERPRPEASARHPRAGSRPLQRSGRGRAPGS